LKQFKSAADKCLTVHDIDLKARDEVKLSPKLFKGSPKWIHNLKKNWHSI